MRRHEKKRAHEKKETKLNHDFTSILRLDLWFFDPHRGKFNFSWLDWLFLGLTTSLAFTTHLWMIGKPDRVVFDEVYFGNFTHYYHTGQYFFDIHPPLGKQLLYLGSRISRYAYNQTYSMIDAPLDYDQVKRLRIWPAITGALRAPMMFLTLRVLDVSSQWALVGGVFVALDQALIVESRFVLIDAYLSMFASFTMLMTAIMSRRPRHAVLVAVVAGIAAGGTVSVKLTGCGVALALVCGLFMSYPLIEAIKLSAIAGFTGIALFLASFVGHFMMFDKPGPGCKFHRRSWCARIAQGTLNPFTSTIELIRQMLSSNFAIQTQHSYSSKWWQWPLMIGKATYMWVDVKGDSRLWCVGSPLVWLSGTLGLLLWIGLVFKYRRLRQTTWVLIGYIISYLPFSLIARVMWNYHYFIPLLFSLIAGAVAADTLAPGATVIPALLIFIEFVSFGVWFPITYGTPITQKTFKRIMFPSWTY